MPIRINSNYSSLQAQRRLDESTAVLQKSFERLSSGLRINHASDDSAGLSVAATLNATAHIFAKGLQNINDGISAYNIADSAMGEVKSLLTRMRELSTQASNGTLAHTQRAALDSEFQALGTEYNRILETTEFNGRPLFATSNKDIQFEAGGSSISLSFGASEVTGDGSFILATRAVTAIMPVDAASADLNGDGNLDLAAVDFTDGVVSVVLGNGDGTFAPYHTYSVAAQPEHIVATDVTGDGVADLVTGDRAGQGLSILVNNGDGTFRAATFVPSISPVKAFAAADVNADGNVDLVSSEWDGVGNSYMSVYLGNGNGTFKSRSSFFSAGGPAYAVGLSDMNGDGKKDIVTTYGTSAGVNVYLSNGDGTFRAAISSHENTGDNLGSLVAADFNGDGLADVAVTDQTDNSVHVYIGNGDGTLRAHRVVSAGSAPVRSALGDFNGDGNADILVANAGELAISVLLGNGDGSFKARTSLGLLAGAQGVTVGDVNNDGIDDAIGSENSGPFFSVYKGNPIVSSVSGMARKLGVIGVSEMSLQTAYDARNAQTKLSRYLSFAEKLSASLGASQSRLQSTVSVLSVTRENLMAAESRITDADIAEESATSVRSQIVQQAAQAVLAQANQQPALALKLLRP